MSNVVAAVSNTGRCWCLK